MLGAPCWRGWRGARPPRDRRAHATSDAESERHLLFGAVVDLLARLSARAPLVLVLDDLQWADRPTVQLFRYVVTVDARLRLLVVATSRDSDLEADHPLAAALATLHREPGTQRLALHGLGDDELLTLLEATAGHELAKEGVALRDALSAETDGNPFFVGEMVRHLAETGAIHQDEQLRWVASEDLRTSGLPISIREVIGQRVARLGTPTRDALSQAAVIGRDFDAEVLALVTGLDEASVIELCDVAADAAVLTGSAVAGRYTFSHALIEHALYDDLSSGRRSRSHRAVAEAIEAICGDDPGDGIGQLAFHWAQATQPPDAGKAITYAQRAGDRALALLAPDEALRWYRDALDLLDRASADDPPQRAVLLLGFGDAQLQTGDPAHRETLLAAGRLAEDIDAVDVLVAAALRNNRGWNSNMGTVDRDRVEMCKRALVRLGDADSPDRARLISLLCVEGTWDADIDERLSMANASRGHRAAHRRPRRAGRRDSALLRGDHDAADPRAPPAMGRRGVRPGRRSRRPDRATPREPLPRRCPRWRPATSPRCATGSPSSSPSPSGSDNRSTGGRSPTTGRGSGALDGDARRRGAGGDRSLDRRHRGRLLGRCPHGLRRPDLHRALACRAGCGEMVPLIEEAMRDNPGLRIFHATLAAAMSLR